MSSFRTLAALLRGDRRGVTALEYGLIAGVLVVTVLVGFNTLGTSLMSQFDNIATDVSNSSSTPD
jgi:pilus assembly protein Flp/PilA